MSEKQLQIKLTGDNTDLRRKTDQARDALGRFVADGKRAGDEVKGGFDLAAAGAEGLGLALMEVAAKQLALSKIVDVGRSIANIFHDAQEEARRLATSTTDLRDKLREIAAIAGSRPGDENADLGKFLDIRKASGLSADEAKQFVTQFRGAGELSRGMTITDEQYQQYMTGLARFTLAKGGQDEAGIYGEFGGSILRFKDYRNAGGAAAALDDMGLAYATLARGKGSNAVLNHQLSQLSAAYVNEDDAKGAFRDVGDAAAAISIAAEYSPESSATTTMQAIRGLRGGGRGRPNKEWMKGAGIDSHDDFFTALSKLFVKIDERVGQGDTADDALQGFGFKNYEERRAFQAFYNNRQLIDSQLGFVNQRRGAGTTAPEIDAKFGTDVSIQRRLAQARSDETRYNLGMEGEQAEVIRIEAERRLRERGEIGTGVGDTASFFRGFGSTEKGKEVLINQEAARILAERGIVTPAPGLGMRMAGALGGGLVGGDAVVGNLMNYTGEAQMQLSAGGFQGQMSGATNLDTHRGELADLAAGAIGRLSGGAQMRAPAGAWDPATEGRGYTKDVDAFDRQMGIEHVPASPVDQIQSRMVEVLERIAENTKAPAPFLGVSPRPTTTR